MEGSGQPAVPSAEELARAQEVSTAAAEAIGEGGTREEVRERVTAAAQQRAKEVQLDLAPESISALVDQLMERMAAMGVFEPPPAPAAAAPAPGQPSAAQLSPEEAAAAAAAAAAEVAPPQKKSFAQRFAGLDS